MQDIIIDKILENALLKTDGAKNLIRALFEVNCELPEEVAALRPSLLNFEQVMKWNGIPENAHAASLMALNSDHGCFAEAFDFIWNYFRYNSPIHIAGNIRIPGFGNPIIKNDDPRCKKLQMAFQENVPEHVYHEIDGMIHNIQMMFKAEKHKMIYPNLVFWNAAFIYTLGLPRQYASLVFILATQITYLNRTLK